MHRAREPCSEQECGLYVALCGSEEKWSNQGGLSHAESAAEVYAEPGETQSVYKFN